MADMERRFTAGRVEVRLGSEKRTIGGYAAKHERTSKNLGGFVEVIAPTFFAKSAGDGFPDVMARYNHDDNMLLGTTGAGTLRLALDKVGLRYEVDVPEARADVFELVTRGDVAKSSFAFITFEDEWGQNDLGIPLRTLVSGKLVDVAPVNVPAYDDTSAGLRSLSVKFSVEFEEIRGMAAKNELTRLFKVTGPGAPVRKMSAAARLAQAKAIV